MENSEAEKKKNFITLSFIVLIAISILSIMSIFNIYNYDFMVQDHHYSLEPISLNYTFKEGAKKEPVIVCFNDYCRKFARNDIWGNVWTVQYNRAYDTFSEDIVKNIYIAHPTRNLKDEIDTIDMHIGNKDYYYSNADIKKFEVEAKKIKLDKEDKEININAIKLPEVNNYRGDFVRGLVDFLSLFYNWKYFLIPYFWLFMAFIFYLYNKDKMKLDINFDKKKIYITLGLITALGFVLRLSDLLYYPIFGDEIYTKAIAIVDFKSIFHDPGNPPLFYIIEYIVSRLFNDNLLTLRIPSLVFGTLCIPAVFLLFKNISAKLALFASFMMSINMINIVQSQEARGYNLDMLLVILGVYFVFKLIENPSRKNIIRNAIMTSLLVNSHYYLILFAFSNTLWTSAALFLQKKKKELFCYLKICSIGYIFALPYLLIVRKAALAQHFNSWIAAFSRENLREALEVYFGSKFLFVLLLFVVAINFILTFYKKADYKKANLLRYSIFSLLFISTIVCLISLYVKPIFNAKIYMSVYALIFIVGILTIATPLNFENLSKKAIISRAIYSIILVLTMFTITRPALKEFFRHSSFVYYMKNDIVRYQDKYEIHALMTDYMDNIKAYPEISKFNINWHVVDSNAGDEIKKVKKEMFTDDKNKKIVIYCDTLGIFGTIARGIVPDLMGYRNAYTFRTNTIPTVKIIFE